MDLPYTVLHCHTTSSDGVLTHKEILDTALSYGVGTVAFTDHDTLLSEEKIKELKALNHNVRFISGIEFSATGTPEVKGTIPSFHIIGLFVNVKDEPLQRYCAEAKKKRRERLTQSVHNLNKQGFVVTEEDVERNSQDGTIGRPHLVRAVLERSENILVIEQVVEKMRVAQEINPALSLRYRDVVNHTPHQQMFDLFLSDDAFVPNVYVPYLQIISLDFAVGLIRGAGGIALLAHPSYYREKIGPKLIAQFAKEGRIDGIETLYAFTPDKSVAKDFQDDIAAFKEINKKYNLISGGGGDLHTPEDFARIFTLERKSTMLETKEFLPDIFAKWPTYEAQVL